MNTHTVNLVGIHLRPPSPNIVTPFAVNLFKRTIGGALERESLLFTLNSGAKMAVGLSPHEILLTVAVSDLSRSLNAVTNELTETDLLQSAHLAWKDFDEEVWRDEWPKNPVVTFEQRIAESHKWPAQAKALLDVWVVLLRQIQSTPVQPTPKNEPLLQ